MGFEPLEFNPHENLISLRQPCQQSAQSSARSSQDPRPGVPIYSMLDPAKKEIRVLEVCSRLSNTGHVVCHFKHVSLLSPRPPAYEALSWCWGRNSEQKTIELNGHRFPVPLNAEEVLRRVCVDHGHHLVWLDAICINQYGLEEREYQVRMMGDIYSKAARTIVWLGEGNDSTDAAIDSLRLILNQIIRETNNFETIVDHLHGGADGDKHAFSTDSSSLPLPPCDWVAISSFFSAPWFNRLWTLQEIELARNVLFYRGDHNYLAECETLNFEWSGRNTLAEHF